MTSHAPAAASDPLSEVVVPESVDELCDIVGRVFGDDFLKADDKDTVVEGFKEKLREKRLERQYDFGDDKETVHQVICEHTSQFKGCHIFVDEESDEKVVYIVETEATANEFRKRGFTERSKVCVPDISMMPEKVRNPGTEVDVFERPVPSDVVLPEIIPKPRKGMTLAETVVEQFEERVVDLVNKEVHAPIRLWTKEKRKGMGRKVQCTLYNRLLCYYAVRTKHVDTDVASIDFNQKQLVADAKNHARSVHREAENEEFWFTQCIDLYNNRIDTS